MTRRALTFFEVDIPFCALIYGEAPCTAELGVTGEAKCYNSRATCQDRANFDPQFVTLRFAKPAHYLPESGIDAIPSIESLTYEPAEMAIGKGLGIRDRLTVRFRDHPWGDTGPGYDKYLSDRDYDPLKQGSYWGKFRARQPWLRGLACRYIRGFVGQSLAEMETRHFYIDSSDGPGATGSYAIIASDVLRLTAADRSQAPALSNGELFADLPINVQGADLSPSGIGAEEYDVPAASLATGQFRHLFGSSALGSGLPTGFTQRWVTTNINYAVAAATAAGRFTGRHLSVATSNATTARRAISFNAPGNADTVQEVLIHAQFTGFSAAADRALFGAALRIAGSSGSETGYTVHLNTNPGGDRVSRLNINRYSGGSFSQLASQLAPGVTAFNAENDPQQNRWYFLRARVEGGTILGKLWDAATPEPSAWDISATDGSPLGAGYCGIFQFDDNDLAARYDFISAGVGGPAAPYPDRAYVCLGGSEVCGYVRTDDHLALVRGDRGSTAKAHEAGDRVQLCLEYIEQRNCDIVEDLFTRFGNVPSDWIALADWQAESDAYLQRVYSTLITEPTGVDELAGDLLEQSGSAVVPDPLDRRIRFQVLRGVPAEATRITPDLYLPDSLAIQDQPNKRVSQVWTYYGKADPTGRDDPDNFRGVAASIDVEAEENHGSPAIKKLYSDWIPPFARPTALRGNLLHLSRYREPPRRFRFALPRGAALRTGVGALLEAALLQDVTGARIPVAVQIVKFDPREDADYFEAEEVRYDPAGLDLPRGFIPISGLAYNLNIRDMFQSLYGDPQADDVVTILIETGAIVGSTSIASPALDIGTWDMDLIDSIRVENRGRIQGKGGNGAAGSIGGVAAQAGGVALRTTVAIEYVDADGETWGGGGGGGRGNTGTGFGNGGGGGAGTNPGNGGSASGSGGPGSPGTADAGGDGGAGSGSAAFSPGGDGGDPGEPGGNASTNGGAAGAAIDGISLVTTIGSAGDRRGGTIN